MACEPMTAVSFIRKHGFPRHGHRSNTPSSPVWSWRHQAGNTEGPCLAELQGHWAVRGMAGRSLPGIGAYAAWDIACVRSSAMCETTAPLPGHLRLIWVFDAEDDIGCRKIFSDTISRCTWMAPAAWDASGRLQVRSALGQQGQAVAPLESGVISRDEDGRECLRSTCGHVLHLDGAGGIRIDAPGGSGDPRRAGVFFVHDPERAAGRYATSLS